MLFSYNGIPQQFAGFDFYNNMLRYAIEKDIWSGFLNEKYWSTDSFKFYVGNIYDLIPKLK